jgi:drug/metabolite transporter (DMT)-like permease
MQVSPYILLALTSLFWSLNFIIGKLVATVMPPATISFFRWLVPCGILLLVSWQEIRAHAPIFRAKWRLILFLGATGYGLNSMCVYEAVRLTTTINTSFINAFNPVLIAVAGYVLYRARIDRVQGLGFLLSLVGVLCIIFQGHWERVFRLQMNGGDLFMLASISIWSVHTVLYQHTVPNFPDRAMFTVMMCGGLLATLPFALFESALDQWSWITRVGTVQVVGILALNLFPSLLAYHFWNQALRKISANRVAMFLYLIPVYTTIISVLFLGEQLRIFHVLGGSLIFLGVLLVTNSRLLVMKGRNHRWR